jgi:hypothetical protein
MKYNTIGGVPIFTTSIRRYTLIKEISTSIRVKL